jgi:hypothetical protein
MRPDIPNHRTICEKNRYWYELLKIQTLFVRANRTLLYVEYKRKGRKRKDNVMKMQLENQAGQSKLYARNISFKIVTSLEK